MSLAHPLAAAPRNGAEFATLGGGCFWCLEAVFEEMDGVFDVESGYAGGQIEAPSYRAVCAGDSGHAEVVRIEFDPERLSYRQLLDVFFAIHDPTTRNRQGNDVGSQYRSAIFAHSALQQRIAGDAMRAAQSRNVHSIVTEVVAATNYFRAEDEHQEYFRHHPEQGYCAFVVAPKVDKFRHSFAALRRKANGGAAPA